jgi:hypothetical protein
MQMPSVVKMESGEQFDVTCVSLTSGQVYDVISALVDRETDAVNTDNLHLAKYYRDIAYQFAVLEEKLKELPGEKRVANLMLIS